MPLDKETETEGQHVSREEVIIRAGIRWKFTKLFAQMWHKAIWKGHPKGRDPVSDPVMGCHHGVRWSTLESNSLDLSL